MLKRLGRSVWRRVDSEDLTDTNVTCKILDINIYLHSCIYLYSSTNLHHSHPEKYWKYRCLVLNPVILILSIWYKGYRHLLYTKLSNREPLHYSIFFWKESLHFYQFYKGVCNNPPSLCQMMKPILERKSNRKGD